MTARKTWLLQELLGDAASTVGDRIAAARVTGLACDSRQVKEGDLFFCLTGASTDGHLFAAQAISGGARAIVAERELALPPGVVLLLVPSARRALARAADRFFGSPSREILAAGITGTNGKTTTSYLLRGVLEQAGFDTGLLGTVEYAWRGERRVPSTTTPDALELQRLLRGMVDAGCRAVVMEVSSHALALDRAAETCFRLAVFTNLSHDHLDFHGTREKYREAKASFFRAEAPYGSERTAVLNIDDPLGREIAAETSLPVVTYGVEGRADVRGELRRAYRDGAELRLHLPSGSHEVRLRLPGRVNVANATAAAAAATAAGVQPEAIVEGLGALVGVPGRLEPVREGQPFAVLVDYAHTPDALERLLAGVREIAAGPVTVVFGCGGDRDRAKRPVMGAIAVRGADRVIITSDNPRSEDPRAIAEEILAGGAGGPRQPELVLDRAEAIRRALAGCPENGIVVIAGKGHEPYQQVGAERRPFDDRQVARAALRALGFGEARSPAAGPAGTAAGGAR